MNTKQLLSPRIIEDYLSGLHTTLWLDWDITDLRQRRQAADFIFDLFVDMMDYAYARRQDARANDEGRVGG